MSKHNTRRRRRLRGFLKFVLAVAVFTALAGALYFLSLSPLERDDRLIGAKRTQNHALFRMGRPMAGTPDLDNLAVRLEDHGVQKGAPLFIRIFKREFELELWMLRNGRFHRFATYPICMWSGTLGPKFKEGDRQSPEGFYTVSKKQLNPNSRWHRSFNLGYPNLFDKSHGRTGSFLMVHGGCGSVGCYAMTDPVITEIWSLVTAALDSGQKRFQVQIFPFRMSDETLDARRDHPEFELWHALKRGHDHFERAWMPPRVRVCNGRYVFDDAATRDGSDPIREDCRDTVATKR